MTVGTSAATNANNETYILYLFAEVAGFSAFGRWLGDGNNPGPTESLGFEAQWLTARNTGSAARTWRIYDNVRDPSNPRSPSISPGDSQGDQNVGDIDFNSTSIQVKSTNVLVNESTMYHDYMAFAVED